MYSKIRENIRNSRCTTSQERGGKLTAGAIGDKFTACVKDTLMVKHFSIFTLMGGDMGVIFAISATVMSKVMCSRKLFNITICVRKCISSCFYLGETKINKQLIAGPQGRVLVLQYCKTKPNSKSWLGICFKLGNLRLGDLFLRGFA
jgi:hypothetical protein